MRKDYNSLNITKTVLITGAAGFIGFHLAKRLAKQGLSVIGYDNINNYYDINLKNSRLDILLQYENFHFIKGDLMNQIEVEDLFIKYRPHIVVNLAAQAGVRYSMENPTAYMQSNLIGFFNILEACRNYPVEHLIYASSSSVYGQNQKVPFSTEDKVDSPVSLYAATKKSNELMAHSYSHLYHIPTTGLRFFTVYGPWGRPDMAYFSFTQNILSGKPIKVYNNGDMYRDFTYIDDIVSGIESLLCNPPINNENGNPYKIYNLGNNKSESLLDFIQVLENHLGVKVEKEYLPMQPGDVYKTYADITDSINDFGYHPVTSIQDGLREFVSWYLQYFNV